MATSDDLVRRWREAKLGERVGGRVLVSIECECDPRAEVLAAVGGACAGLPSTDPLVRELSGEPAGPTLAGDLAAMTAAVGTGTVTIADPPPRRERKRGGRS